MDVDKISNEEVHSFYFSIIIPSYNRVDLLEQTLKALENQTFSKNFFEVIVVNDGSSDTTSEFLERYKNRGNLNFSYINKENEGQGIARNAGLEIAEGFVVVFLQDDVIPTSNFLEEHKKVHDRFFTENFICLGCTKWHPEVRVNKYMKFLIDSGMQFKFQDLEKQKIIDPVLGLRKADYHHFYTSNISIKRSLLNKEKFNHHFKKYGWEDIELGLRLTDKDNAIILYHKDALAFHYHEIKEESFEKRMRSVGQNAYKALKLNKKMNLVRGNFLTRFIKNIIFFIIRQKFVIYIFDILRSKDDQYGELTFFDRMYYYGKMKRFFFEGVKAERKVKGEREKVKEANGQLVG